MVDFKMIDQVLRTYLLMNSLNQVSIDIEVCGNSFNKKGH